MHVRRMRRATHLARDQTPGDNLAWRIASRWPRALQALILALLALPLLCLPPPRTAAEFRRSALSQPAPDPSMRSKDRAGQFSQAVAAGQPSPPVQAQPSLRPDAIFSHLTIDQALSDQRVQAVAQDRVGVMWFGTNNGLDRYDGYDVVTYRNDPTNPHSLSGNLIEDLYEDHSGTLWVGTRSGLNAFDRRTERFTRYLHDPADPRSLSDNTVIAIYEDRSGILWIGTTSGLNRFDRATGTFTVYRHDPADPHSLSHDVIWDIYQDRAGTLWVGTDGGGLNSFDPSTNSADGIFTHYRHDPNNPHSLSVDRVDCIFEDAAGALWIGTFGGGLSVLDPPRQTFTTYRHDSTVPASVSSDYVAEITADRSGLIWIGTHGSGVDVYNPQRQAFTIYQHDPKVVNSLASDNVSAVYEDQDGVLWVGTQDAGLDRFDRRSGQVIHYPPDPGNPRRLSHPYVMALEQDQAGAMWVGTYGGGLYRLDPASGVFTAYRHDEANPHSLSDDAIFDIHMDRSGALWIATRFGGLNRLDPKTGVFTIYRHDPANSQSLGNDGLRAIEEDQQGNIWIGTLGGGLNRLDPATGQITRYQHDPQNPASLGDNNVFGIHLDRSGVLWVGMVGSGLDSFDPATGTFTHYRERDGLASDRIVSILEDVDAGDRAAGNLWIATGRGLSKLDRDRKTFHTYDTTDGLPPTEYNRGRYRTRNGELLISSIDGLIAFEPAAVRDDAYVPPVVFADFRLGNEPVAIDQNGPLQQAIDQTNTIEIRYADRIVSFKFAALSYWAPHQNRYRYKLEGFDQEWIEVDAAQRLITYTNLDPGRYVFRVSGANSDGVWNETGRTLTLIVTPPWWATWWFRGLAIALIAGLGTALYLLRVSGIQAQRRRLEIQVAERTNELVEKTAELEAAKNQAESANRAKSMFLAMMSHELRTPLHVILGFAQILARRRDLPPEYRESTAAIQRSGEHLLTLINNVLDLSKIESDRMTLNEATVNLDQLLDQLESMFLRRAADKGLRLRFVRAGELPRAIRTDRTRLHQVLINLLDNAVKFTEAGEITLRVTTDHRPPTTEERGLKIEDSNGGADETLSSILYLLSSNDPSVVGGQSPALSGSEGSVVVFEVEDTGPGILPAEQEQIFDAFAQGAAGYHARRGNGLGLAICHRFVQLIGGTLTMRSEPGRGTLFTVALPLRIATDLDGAEQTAVRQVVALAAGQPRYRILIADDQADNRQILVRLLAPLGFELREADDGQDALAIWRAWRPHLIWIDLRMPLLDGYEAARRIQAESPAEQLPVLLALSASSLDEERAMVLAAGFADLIRKPFRVDEIMTAMGRHLGLRYVYEDALPAAHGERASSARSPEPMLDPAALAKLPIDIVAELEQGARETDPALLSRAIEQIRPLDPPLAESLTALMGAFAYRQILAGIQATKDNHAHADS